MIATCGHACTVHMLSLCQAIRHIHMATLAWQVKSSRCSACTDRLAGYSRLAQVIPSQQITASDNQQVTAGCGRLQQVTTSRLH